MGVRVVWDPSPAVGFPPEAYALVDVLTPNQTEAAALTGVDVRDAASAEAAAHVLVGRGAGAVVVKMGEGGTFYLSGRGRRVRAVVQGKGGGHDCGGRRLRRGHDVRPCRA